MNDKVGKPRRVDVTPAGRASVAAKSRIRHLKSILPRMIDAARTKGNELEVRYLEELNGWLPDDTDDPPVLFKQDGIDVNGGGVLGPLETASAPESKGASTDVGQ
jgi:hypothetical protein